MLYPDFPIFDINMQYAAMHTSDAIPTNMHQFVVIAFVINDHFGFDLTMGRSPGSILVDESLYDGSVVFCSIHWTTVS